MTPTPKTTNPRDFQATLARAREALSLGWWDAAAVICRTTLETRLRAMCLAVDCEQFKSNGRAMIGDYLCFLMRSYRMTIADKRRVEKLAKVGNDAAHGHPISYDRVVEMIDGVELYLRMNPLPRKKRKVAA